MNHTAVIWLILAWVLSLVLTFFLSWHFGKREGISFERWRASTQLKIDRMPYSGLFHADDPVEKAKLPPLIVREKGKRHGIG